MNRLTTPYRALSPSSRRVFWVVAAIAGLLTVLSLALIESLLKSSTLLDLLGVSIPMVLAFIAIISAISIFYNRVRFGAWLFFISTMAAMLALPFIQQGIAFPAAVLVLVVTVLIPLQVTSGRSATGATISGFVIAGAIITIDTFWTGKRAGITSQDLQAIRIATGGLAIILFISIAGLYRTFNLRTKLLLLSLGASLLSVIAVAGAASFYTETTLSQNTREKLLSAANHTADTIDSYISFNADLIKTEAALPIFSQYLSSSEADRNAIWVEVEKTMQALAQRDTQNIGSYALLDKNGVDVWDSYLRDVGLDKSDRDYFTNPFNTGKTFISPVRFSPTSPDHDFYIDAPLLNPKDGTILGVLRIRIRSSLLENILKSNDGAAGQDSYAILLDEFNVILADSAYPEYTSRTVTELDAAVLARLKDESRLLENVPDDEISLNMGSFSDGLGNSGTTPFFESITGGAFDQPVQVAVKTLSNQPWKIAFVQPSAIAQAPVQQQTRTITAVALITSFLLGIATLLISRTITEPVARLTEAAEKISAGNLDVRANVRVQDELGTLAATINNMSDRLKQTLAGLETTIAERTADLEERGKELAQRSGELELTNQRSERRASQLFAVSSVSNAISTVQNLDELLPLITNMISQHFNFYHAGIFLNDETNQFAILRAANSAGGQRMLSRGHRLKIGETGLVGNVAATGRPRIALDTGIDAVFFNNPDLPDTHSEMALPLRSGMVVIGVLDVQSLEPNAFSDEDIEIIGVLAGQVSTAIRNAQLFDEIQRNVSETKMLLQQDTREQWQRMIHRQKRAGYYFDGVALTSMDKPAKKDEGVILIPIAVRGQTIGNLGIRTPPGYKLKVDEMDIIKAISERLAISAENARLLEDSQLRAAKERTIGQISDRIGSSTNLDNVFHALLEELGQVLPGSEIVVQFNEENDSR